MKKTNLTILVLILIIIMLSVQLFQLTKPIKQQVVIKKVPIVKKIIQRHEEDTTCPVKLGHLTEEKEGQRIILPLYGMKTFPNSFMWNYYTQINTEFTFVKLPIYSGNRDCLEDIGCKELYDKDLVKVPDVSKNEFRVHLEPKRFVRPRVVF